MQFLDERERTHYGYWYQKVADNYCHLLPIGTLARLGEPSIHLHDPDENLEAIHHKQLLYIGYADPCTVILYPERMEAHTADDVARFDLVTNCLSKAFNELNAWKKPPRLKTPS